MQNGQYEYYEWDGFQFALAETGRVQQTSTTLTFTSSYGETNTYSYTFDGQVLRSNMQGTPIHFVRG